VIDALPDRAGKPDVSGIALVKPTPQMPEFEGIYAAGGL